MYTCSCCCSSLRNYNLPLMHTKLYKQSEVLSAPNFKASLWVFVRHLSLLNKQTYSLIAIQLSLSVFHSAVIMQCIRFSVMAYGNGARWRTTPYTEKIMQKQKETQRSIIMRRKDSNNEHWMRNYRLGILLQALLSWMHLRLFTTDGQALPRIWLI